MVVGEIPVLADLLVLGGGPGGYAAALRGAQLGRQVILIDSDGEAGVGGVCLRVGCIPSKALIEVADQLHGLRTATDTGIVAGPVGFDLAAWQRHKADVVSGLTDGVCHLLRGAGVSVFAGVGRLSRPDQLVVTDPRNPAAPAQYFQFRDLVVATGSRPTGSANLARDGQRILDSTDVLALEELPRSMVVVGGGYIGLELGTALAKLGTKVTIVESLDRLLPAMDAMFGAQIARRAKRLGIDVVLNARAMDFDGTSLRVQQGDTAISIAADNVLVAVGRTPNTDELGLDAAGIVLDRAGLIPVGSDCRATAHIAAIGDITRGPALAHKAMAEAEVAVEALCGHRVEFSPAAIPAVVFCDPEVATAGLTIADATTQGVKAVATTVALAASGRAATIGARDGFLQLVWERASTTVLGVHIVGPHASELIAEGVLAIEMAAALHDIATSIHAHPTLSEQLGEAARLALGRPVHVLVPRQRHAG